MEERLRNTKNRICLFVRQEQIQSIINIIQLSCIGVVSYALLLFRTEHINGLGYVIISGIIFYVAVYIIELLYLDDNMKTEALPSTNMIKTIVTAEEEMDLERKGKQSYQGRLVCRILAFGNGTLKALFDRSKGFYRRQIIHETKDIPPDRVNDPYLADKMIEEVEGIVLWCIEGLERLFKNNYQFTISDKSKVLMEEMQEDDDNILSFLESTGYIRIEKGTHATSKKLESGRFCRGFRGVHVQVRTDEFSYQTYRK